MYRTAAWALVAAILVSSLAGILGTAAATSTTSYALNGYVDQPGGTNAPPVPAGVTVDLVSRATGATFTTTTTSGGAFSFTSASTSSALVPGYWGIYVPPAANVSLTGCKHCAVLPQNQTPAYSFYSGAVLTNPNDTQIITNVGIYPYVADLNGNVTLNGTSAAAPGASVQLLAPQYAGFVLVSNTTTSTGFYNMSVPEGTWVLQVTYTQGPKLFTNTSSQTFSTANPRFSPVVRPFSISGRVYSYTSGSYVSTSGNATLYDAKDHYIYSYPMAPGGYYSFDSYPANFVSGSQTFHVIVSAVGFQTGAYSKTVNAASAPIAQKVTVNATKPANLGQFDTTLDLTALNTTTGHGSLSVNTSVSLGNDSAVPGLPNASVGQLWAQLGLDFNNSLTFPVASLPTLERWITSQGPFFPAVQASTTVNGTGFIGPKTAQPAPTFGSSPSCATVCGLNNSSGFSYAWQDSYVLNGTLPHAAGTYVISFAFAHPTTSADVYNYTVVLPKHYVLAANTVAPAQTTLVGVGKQGTWTNFTLESKVSSTAAATATLTIVREASLTANVAVSSNNTTFTSANVLNDSHYNYTAVLGVGMNATFSAAPSVYPAGVNGTKFEWYWGDKLDDWSNVTTETTYHIYTVANATGKPYHGTLTIISSSGLTNITTFNISVVSSAPTAEIASNATAAQTKSVASTTFLVVDWSTTLHFNATLTKIASPNSLAIAQYTLKANDFNSSANFSTAKGASAFANWTVAFGANTTNSTTASGHGLYLNFSNVKINGSAPGVTGFGWMYNLTLQVWTLVGTTSTAHLTILVNDTEKPVPKITLESSSGKAITNSSVVEGPNHYAVVRLNASGSVDYGNGSIVKYIWSVNNTNTSTSFKNFTWQNSTVKPLPTVQLGPKTTDYKINLTVVDENGNKASANVSLSVAQNTTLRPIMQANNLTGPATVNAGTSYSYWVNITVGGGAKSTAYDVQVSFYLLSPSGTGTRTFVGGAPGSVVFYGYSNSSSSATVNSTPLHTGNVTSLKYGKTVRAVLTWTPSSSGSFILYANATAKNQFVNGTTPSVASLAVSVHTNPTTQLLEYGGIAAGVVVVLAVLVLYFRRRTRKPGTSKPSSSKSGLERSKSSDDDDE